jgi:hypothetical protein
MKALDNLDQPLSPGDIVLATHKYGFSMCVIATVNETNDNVAPITMYVVSKTGTREIAGEEVSTYRATSTHCYYLSRLLKLNGLMCEGYPDRKHMDHLQNIRRMILNDEKVPRTL